MHEEENKSFQRGWRSRLPLLHGHTIYDSDILVKEQIIMKTFTWEPLHEDDIVVYLKNERTGSSTIRKCKFVGKITGFTDTKVKIRQLSKADQFITPEETVDYGEVSVYPEDVVHILISRYQLDNWLHFPHTIGGITFYSKKELIEWVVTAQEKYNELLVYKYMYENLCK